MHQTAELLRDLVEAGLTQAEISRRAKVPQPRLSRWFGGAVPAGAEAALRIQQLHASVVRTGVAQHAIKGADPDQESSHATA